jgi:ATP synthase protein I
MSYISNSYNGIGLLDTFSGCLYGARDFEGVTPLFHCGSQRAKFGMAQDDKRAETGDLASRISKAQSERISVRAARAMRRNEMTGVGRAFRLASEFIAAIIMGAAVGFGLDALFGTRPWFLVALLLLGFAAGVLNVVRATSELNRMTADTAKGVPAVTDDEDD